MPYSHEGGRLSCYSLQKLVDLEPGAFRKFILLLRFLPRDRLHRRGRAEWHEVPLTERHLGTNPEDTSGETVSITVNVQDVPHENRREFLHDVALKWERLLSVVNLANILSVDRWVPGLQPGRFLRLSDPL